jgi:hypothetical protein
MIVGWKIEQDEDTGKNRIPRAMYKLSLERGKDTTADRSLPSRETVRSPSDSQEPYRLTLF